MRASASIRIGMLGMAMLAVCGAAIAQSVGLSGMLGNKALLIVDGNPPRTVAPGETHLGVKVVSTNGDEAIVEIKGQRHKLRVGEAPASVGGKGIAQGSNKIVLHAGSGGHFVTQGSINGRAVQFLVDTGASNVALSMADAERVGLDYKSGQPIRVGTANGISPGWRIKLSSVRIGDVEVYEVDGIVSPEPMPFVLLGNSFLTRFQMRRDNEQMTLEKRY